MEIKMKLDARRYNQLIAQIDAVYHELALKQGYSDSEMSILYALSDNDGECLLGDIIKQSALSKQTVNSALRKLEKREILYSESAGGKAKRILLTEKGRAVVSETVEKILEAENRVYASWKPEEWQLYVELTEQFLKQIQKEMRKL